MFTESICAFIKHHKNYNWHYNESRFRRTSGFHGKDIIEERQCCEIPMGRNVILQLSYYYCPMLYLYINQLHENFTAYRS